MLILEELRIIIWKMIAFLRKQPRNMMIAYLICITVLGLCLWNDSGSSVEQHAILITQARQISLSSSYSARMLYVAGRLGRCHLVLLIFYVFYRYFKWARSTIASDEARFTSMRKDTMNAIAHEVRTPLAAILGYTENLKLGICEDKKQYYLEQIELKGHEISRMIDDILSIAKLEDSEYHINPERLCVNDLLGEICADYDASFAFSEKDEWIIDADREYFVRMLKCLIDNAVRYRTEGTEINVSVSRFGMKIHNQSEPISDEQLKHIFEFRAKPDGRYSFGLYYCHKAAEKNGIHMAVCNENNGVTASLC